MVKLVVLIKITTILLNGLVYTFQMQISDIQNIPKLTGIKKLPLAAFGYQTEGSQRKNNR